MSPILKVLVLSFLTVHYIEGSEIQEEELLRQIIESAKKENNAEVEGAATKTACINYFKVEAHTGSWTDADQSPNHGKNPRLAIKLRDGNIYSAEIDGKKDYDSDVTRIIGRYSMTPKLPSCISRTDITDVYLKSIDGGKDGWYVSSIDAYTARSRESPFVLLTSNPNFNRWVDYDEQSSYPYDTRLVPLKLVQKPDNCITSLKIVAETGNVEDAGFSSEEMGGQSHKIVLQLEDAELQGDMHSPAQRNQNYTSEMDLAADLDAAKKCVRIEDINEVRLQAGGSDGWFINKIATLVSVEGDPYQELTSNTSFQSWLDGNEEYPYDATEHILSAQHYPHKPVCGFGVRVCTCPVDARVCELNLEVDEMETYTSYEKFNIVGNRHRHASVRGMQGVIFDIASNGEMQPLEQYSSRPCYNYNSNNCSDPLFVDGKTYRMAIGINGLIPGPTLIVHDQQTVLVHVHNNMSSEGTSIHWHGMHQVGSPWMDGVGQLTQCQIEPSTTFTYQFTASPSGTFWYHSHSGAQRTEGVFGALIVRERTPKMRKIRSRLASFGIHNFEDHPGLHSISLLDWQLETSIEIFTQLNPGLGFYPGTPAGEVPPNDPYSRYNSTHSYDNGEVGPVPFFSGLMNGKGRHGSVPYAKTRLSVFPVQSRRRYRFRLIGAQGLYAYRFSIDEHKLTVVSTDGYWTEPVQQVDYIIVHAGERYDFFLETKESVTKNYWMRAETLEMDRECNGGIPPCPPLNTDHVAEAVLQYVDGDLRNAPIIHSSEYLSIKTQSHAHSCQEDQKCKAVNCPFERFHPSYHIDCINVQDLQLLLPTPPDQLPQPLPSTDDCLHFFNFNFEGDGSSSAINGRNFILPPAPPLTQREDFLRQAKVCSLNASCNPSTLDCLCTHIIDIPYKKTVQFVLSAVGVYYNSHPIHLHGHTFHVVHVGYPEYSPDTGFIQQQNSDIACDDKQCQNQDCDARECTKPRWANNYTPAFSINSTTVRKDTVIVPAGGYVVINIISDNPGYWFMHCHIEVHQLEGMALVINEALEEQRNLTFPDNIPKCGIAV